MKHQQTLIYCSVVFAVPYKEPDFTKVLFLQSSLGTAEDGIMTSDLLERLFMERSLKEHTNQGGDSVSGVVKVCTTTFFLPCKVL